MILIAIGSFFVLPFCKSTRALAVLFSLMGLAFSIQFLLSEGSPSYYALLSEAAWFPVWWVFYRRAQALRNLRSTRG